MAGLRLQPASEDGSAEGNRKLQRIGNEAKPTLFRQDYNWLSQATLCRNVREYAPGICPPDSISAQAMPVRLYLNPIRHCKNHNPAILEHASKVSRGACPPPGAKRNNSLEYLPLARRLLPGEESSGHLHRQNKSNLPHRRSLLHAPARDQPRANAARLFYAAFFRMSARSVLASLIGIRLNFSTSTFKTSGVINAGKVGPRRILRMPR